MGLIILMNLMAVILCIKNIIIHVNRYFPLTYNLGIIDRYGYVGVKIKYDTEPVDVELISPTGKHYQKDNCNIYETDKTNKTIIAMVDTTETGLWKTGINQKNNKNINYTFLTRTSSVLHMEDAKIIEIDGDPYISFIPVMGSEYASECSYSIILKNKDKSFSLKTGKAPLNKQACIMLDPPESAFTGDSYNVTISISSLTEKPTHTSQTFNIFLAEHKEKEINNDNNTESNTDTESDIGTESD